MNDFLDYEATAKTLTEFPFDEENDWVKDRARIKAHKTVDAALGDEPLYRHDLSRDDAHVHPPCFVQVWSKDNDDE